MPLATDTSNFDACYHRVYGHQLFISKTRRTKHHCPMLSLLSLLLAPLLAVSVLAESTMSTEQSSTLSKFTLAAHNTTLPNANGTGVPLVLGQNGATTGMSFQVTSTFASYPYNDFPTLSFLDGLLIANLASGESITNATEVESGRKLRWVTSRYPPWPVTPGASFSVVDGQLAVHERVDAWSLCPSYKERGQNDVVYDVDMTGNEETLGYEPQDCYGVTLNVVSVE